MPKLEELFYKAMCKEYIRPWGKHKNGIQKLVYMSGDKGEVQKWLNGVMVDRKTIVLKCRRGDLNVDGWASENGFKYIPQMTGTTAYDKYKR
jgi:hypothetical protein